jgi:SRSO17 transposase
MAEATVSAEQLIRTRKELDVFLQSFDGCIRSTPTRQHLRTYVAGQTSKLERKSIEPMALEAGVAPRTLQEFLGLHRWDHLAMRDRIQQRVADLHSDKNAIAIIDETSVPKKGDKTPGVQWQYCGATGKTDNCVVTVHLAFATETFATILDSDLFLPEGWDQDRMRCQEAGIPEEVRYRPKWRIALELLDRSLRNGVQYKFVTADEFYGRGAPFRAALDLRGLLYVVEVPCNQRGWVQRPRLVTGRQGRLRLADNQLKARRADALWLRGGPSWKAYHIKDTEKGPLVWEARVARFSPRVRGIPGPEAWLLVARNVLSGETKYFLSNAPADTPIPALLHVAFSRARIEESFETAKGDIGYDHFEVRTYLALQRHVILSMLSLLYLTEQTQRLRGEKPVVEPQPGSRSGRSAA